MRAEVDLLLLLVIIHSAQKEKNNIHVVGRARFSDYTQSEHSDRIKSPIK